MPQANALLRAPECLSRVRQSRRDAVRVVAQSRASGEERAGRLCPRRFEGGLQLLDAGTFETHAGFVPGAGPAAVHKPFVIDAETARSSNSAVDADSPGMGRF